MRPHAPSNSLWLTRNGKLSVALPLSPVSSSSSPYFPFLVAARLKNSLISVLSALEPALRCAWSCQPGLDRHHHFTTCLLGFRSLLTFPIPIYTKSYFLYFHDSITLLVFSFILLSRRLEESLSTPPKHTHLHIGNNPTL